MLCFTYCEQMYEQHVTLLAAQRGNIFKKLSIIRFLEQLCTFWGLLSVAD